MLPLVTETAFLQKRRQTSLTQAFALTDYYVSRTIKVAQANCQGIL